MRNVAQTAFWMAVLTLISKLFGFVREMVIAGFYGTSYITDAYVMATSIPTIIFGGIFGAVATAYMPIFSKLREGKGEKEGDKFTSEIINLLLLLSILVGLVGLVFSDQIVSFFARGFNEQAAELTSYFVKITFWYVLFTSIIGVLNSYLQYKGIFLPQIVAGYCQSLGAIVVIIISAFTSHYLLAFGMLLGTAGNFFVISYVARKKGFKYKSSFSLSNPVRQIMGLAIPVFIGSSVRQINSFVDKTLASGLIEGSVSALNYAMLLITLVTSLTTTILVTIIYPKITKANTLKEYDSFNEIIGKGVILIILITMPVTLGSLVYNDQIVQIIYERGAFDPVATALTSSAFFFYTLGLPFTALNALFVNVYYSKHNMKTPIIFGIISVIISIVLNLLLIKPMAHNGLALATSIASMVNMALLYIGLKNKYPYITMIKSRRRLFKVILAAVVAVGLSWLLYNYAILALSHIVVARIVQLGLVVVFAGVVYLILLKMFKIEELILIRGFWIKR
jgi:putative peptidoglycan lipid II flippase